MRNKALAKRIVPVLCIFTLLASEVAVVCVISSYLSQFHYKVPQEKFVIAVQEDPDGEQRNYIFDEGHIIFPTFKYWENKIMCEYDKNQSFPFKLPMGGDDIQNALVEGEINIAIDSLWMLDKMENKNGILRPNHALQVLEKTLNNMLTKQLSRHEWQRGQKSTQMVERKINLALKKLIHKNYTFLDLTCVVHSIKPVNHNTLNDCTKLDLKKHKKIDENSFKESATFVGEDEYTMEEQSHGPFFGLTLILSFIAFSAIVTFAAFELLRKTMS